METLAAKAKADKEALLAQLAKYPIVETACARVGVGRSTYYDWRQRDRKFRELADKALSGGKSLINDMAESMLIKNIQDGSNTSIIFWLKNHHGDYSDRVYHEHEFTFPEISEEEAGKISVALHNIGLREIIKMNSAQEKKLDENLAKAKEEWKPAHLQKPPPQQEVSPAALKKTVPLKKSRKGHVDLKAFFAKRRGLSGV